MIRFPCKCGHGFNLTDEWAGSLTQCPRCGRAVDVPTLSDLAHLDADGTFVVDDLPDRPASSAVVAQMHRAFSPHTVDAYGNVKDLRGPIADDGDDVEEVGDGDELELLPEEPAPVRVKPRYDPITGHLIRPLELKDDTPLPVLPVLPVEDDPSVPLEAIPIPAEPLTASDYRPPQPATGRAGRSLGYATEGATHPINPATLAMELLMPASAIVLVILFFVYLAAALIGQLLANLSAMFSPALMLLDLPLWLIAAHYGCVVEETGPHALDELPRPLRNFAISEDLLNPLMWVGLSAAICFGPAVLVCSPKLALDPQIKALTALVLGLAGSLFFPAVLLTAITGTTLTNLRPDRVAGVIFACGGEYVLSVGMFLLAAATGGIYLFPLVTAHLHLDENVVLKHVQDPVAALPMLLASVYLGHYFCWHLGLLYRAHHEEFPWLLQRHVRTPRPAKHW